MIAPVLASPTLGQGPSRDRSSLRRDPLFQGLKTGICAGTVHSRVVVFGSPRGWRGEGGPAMLVTVREPCVRADNCDTIPRDEEELCSRAGVLVFSVFLFGRV
jgi:hypothetical protein